jgi:hypothetical protein
MKNTMNLSNVNDAHFHVVQNVLNVFILLIIIIVQFTGFKLYLLILNLYNTNIWELGR